jgi:hypothetical protein
MMTVEVLTGPPGSGKSTVMRLEAVKQPGRYLFAYMTERLLTEQAAEFGREVPLSAMVLEAHSKSPGRRHVQKKLDDAAAQVAASRTQHAIVLITHNALMAADLSAFEGWHFRIDEAPDAIQSGTEKSKIVRSFLKEHFELESVGDDGWHVVNLKPSAKAAVWKDEDGLSKGQAELLNQAQRVNRVFVKAPDFSGSFEWVSVWSPHVLEPIAASVIIAGASYPTSIGALVAASHVGFVERPILMARTGSPTIRIHYFTQGHEGSTALWKTSEGRAFIVKLCDYLVANAPGLGFWSANEPVANLLEHRVSGELLSPKAAGQNAFRKRTSCAFIYSARPTPNDMPIKDLFGLTDDEIRVARQDEDVIQFVMRGAIRNPDYAGDYDIYLYSRAQAERLRNQLLASEVGVVELHPVDDAGFMDAVRAAGSHKADKPDRVTSLTGRLVKAASAKKTARRHARAVAKGRIPGRAGRPLKH